MNQLKMLAPIGLVVLALVIYASTFVVKEWEVALKLRLGEIVDSEYEPGLHFMVPVLNNIKTFDGRIQTLDSSPERFLTIEKKDVIVDSYAKWRITDPGQFYRSTGGDSERTARLLAERINTSLRDEFGRRTIQEVVSDDRLELMQALTKQVDLQVGELGIEVVDIRVKKIDLPPEVSESVYQRMRAERERVARDLRAKGGEAAERIRADADRQRIVTLADAYKLSEEVRGEGDAKAAETYANAFNSNREFYSFYRSLNAYRSSFGQGGDMMVLQPESEFFRYFKEMGGRNGAGTTSPAGMSGMAGAIGTAGMDGATGMTGMDVTTGQYNATDAVDAIGVPNTAGAINTAVPTAPAGMANSAGTTGEAGAPGTSGAPAAVMDGAGMSGASNATEAMGSPDASSAAGATGAMQ